MRNDGAVRLLKVLLRALAARLFAMNAADWYHCELTDAVVSQPRPPGAEIDFASPEVLDWLRSLQPDFRWVWVDEEVATASRNGHIFPLVRIDGAKAGYLKVGLGEAYVTDFSRNLILPDRSAFIYDAFVDPEFRGRGVARWARAETMRWLQEQGIVSVWSHIPRWNRAAVAVVESCGCRRVAFIRHARFVRWHRYSRDPERLMAEATGLVRGLIS